LNSEITVFGTALMLLSIQSQPSLHHKNVIFVVLDVQFNTFI